MSSQGGISRNLPPGATSEDALQLSLVEGAGSLLQLITNLHTVPVAAVVPETHSGAQFVIWEPLKAAAGGLTGSSCDGV